MIMIGMWIFPLKSVYKGYVGIMEKLKLLFRVYRAQCLGFRVSQN